MNWEVLFYTKANGRMVVDEFIQSLDRTAKAKTVHLIDLLARYGTDLGMPHTKTLGGGLLELRVHGKHEVRILYIFARHRQIFLLHGFIKKTQATPIKELNIAHRRQKEIKNL